MGWKDELFVFGDSFLDYPKTSYPVKDITEVNFDGSVTGTIDEDRLSAVQRLALDAIYG